MGTDLKVLNTSFAIMPLEKAVYLFGSKVSVCAIPPAIQSKITVSAVAVNFDELQPLNKPANGAPAVNAARVALLLFFKNSLRFQ